MTEINSSNLPTSVLALEALECTYLHDLVNPIKDKIVLCNQCNQFNLVSIRKNRDSLNHYTIPVSYPPTVLLEKQKVLQQKVFIDTTLSPGTSPSQIQVTRSCYKVTRVDNPSTRILSFPLEISFRGCMATAFIVPPLSVGYLTDELVTCLGPDFYLKQKSQIAFVYPDQETNVQAQQVVPDTMPRWDFNSIIPYQAQPINKIEWSIGHICRLVQDEVYARVPAVSRAPLDGIVNAVATVLKYNSTWGSAWTSAFQRAKHWITVAVYDVPGEEEIERAVQLLQDPSFVYHNPAATKKNMDDLARAGYNLHHTQLIPEIATHKIVSMDLSWLGSPSPETALRTAAKAIDGNAIVEIEGLDLEPDASWGESRLEKIGYRVVAVVSQTDLILPTSVPNRWLRT